MLLLAARPVGASGSAVEITPGLPAGHERPGRDLPARDIGDDFRLHPVGRPKHLPPPQWPAVLCAGALTDSSIDRNFVRLRDQVPEPGHIELAALRGELPHGRVLPWFIRSEECCQG